jgi:hypothetical protein
MQAVPVSTLDGTRIVWVVIVSTLDGTRIVWVVIATV